MIKSQGKLIIFSAPSGSGKTTIVKHLLSKIPALQFSISATTRPRRENEIDGKDYYFLDVATFLQKIEKEAFVEYEEVYKNRFYGTLKSEVQRIWSEGKHVIFDVDVEGGINLKKQFGGAALAIFVRPPSLAHLAQRLKTRQTENEAEQEIRIAKAAYELKFEKEFDRTLVNDVLEITFAEAEEMVVSFLKSEN